MKQNPAFFGVGVGQSFDNPREAALVVYIDRKQVPASPPPTINGLRTRYIIMNRLHVTRSYLMGPVRSRATACRIHPRANQTATGSFPVPQTTGLESVLSLVLRRSRQKQYTTGSAWHNAD